MKKNTLQGHYCLKSPNLKQLFRIMRITTFLLLVCIFCSFASTTHSQNMRVSISKSSTQLNKIFSEIEKQTEYLFVYNNQIDVNRKVSVKVKDKQVSQVLDELFEDTNIEYT